MFLRNFTFNSIEQFGEVMLAVLALLVPIVALSLFLTT